VAGPDGAPHEGIGIPAEGLAVLPGGRYAVTGGLDGAFRVWKLPEPPVPVTWQ
jgi:hypothetical protein